MSTHSIDDLRSRLDNVVRQVAATNEEAIITDNGSEIAVIISLADYERLHEHADVADALRLTRIRAAGFDTMTLDEMLHELGVSADQLAFA